MVSRRFVQCDVFTSVPTKGNGLAVVIDGEGLSDEAMQGFAAWTNTRYRGRRPRLHLTAS